MSDLRAQIIEWLDAELATCEAARVPLYIMVDEGGRNVARAVRVSRLALRALRVEVEPHESIKGSGGYITLCICRVGGGPLHESAPCPTLRRIARNLGIEGGRG